MSNERCNLLGVKTVNNSNEAAMIEEGKGSTRAARKSTKTLKYYSEDTNRSLGSFQEFSEYLDGIGPTEEQYARLS